ncbi:MAG: alpha/beta hydrolase [Burkholderiales bacterium]|nr:alpha/beta hydrolase [Burkholderiales bacterium]
MPARPLGARRVTRAGRWRWAGRCGALLLSAWLAGCGGGGGGDPGGAGNGGEPVAAPPGADPAPTPDPPAPAPPVVVEEPAGRGRTLAVERLLRITAVQVREALAALGAQAPPLQATYDVVAWRITYVTLDAEGREVPASGLMAVPVKPPAARSPVLSYQHGTIFNNAEAPSNAAHPEAPPILLAAAGYLVVAADYVGYGVSQGTPHPYLLSAPGAAAVVDLLVAAHNWRARNSIAGNGQLFLAGYSEGGYTTMAAHRALEADKDAALAVLRAALVSVVPGAGPYHLAATLDALLEQIRDDNPLLAALIDPGFLRHLGSSVRAEVRRALVRKLLPGDADVAFDTRFIDAYLDDDRDKIERQSNVHDWRPTLPVRLFHGRDDRTVPYVSSSSTLQAMQARAAPDVSLVDCRAAPAGHLECVPGYFAYMLGMLAAHVRDL